MSDRTAAAAWVEAYRRAWESNEPDDIRAVFTDDARYFPSPDDDPWTGIDEIVEGWLENSDEEGSTSFAWEVVAVDGDVAVIRAVSTYPDTVFDNVWIVALAEDGRAREFTDFWIARED
ncbi:MAG TPA: nuclear transport factor 2 family protein [Rhodoglobus sp.]|nr:nuclear transport factor 2 family protein [Rhodoglobus sp.]